MASRANPGEEHLEQLDSLLDSIARRGIGRLDIEGLARLPKLYRYTPPLVARLETSGHEKAALERARGLLARAHGVLYRNARRSTRSPARRLLTYLRDDVPRAVRAEWKVLATSFGLLYGLALVAWFAVRQDLELAYSLLDAGSVANEIQQLQGTEAGETFRGNFTFGPGESPRTAGWIMAHNMGVALIFFSAGLIPPLFFYVLATNGLMLGTYTAVAGHWGQAGSISSILWCHGTLEIQALVFAGAGGMILLRAWIAPGSWSRKEAMRRESRRALRILAPMFPMLFAAGLIEGFVSPHASTPVRYAVAIATGVMLLAWMLFAGRTSTARASV